MIQGVSILPGRKFYGMLLCLAIVVAGLTVPRASQAENSIFAVQQIRIIGISACEASLSNLSGPINIAQYAGEWARAGLISFLFFLALISISLGFVNLLPIPLLDGGQLFYLVIEAIRRKPLSERAEAIGQRVGLSLIVLLVGFAVFNDLSRLVHS